MPSIVRYRVDPRQNPVSFTRTLLPSVRPRSELYVVADGGPRCRLVSEHSGAAGGFRKPEVLDGACSDLADLPALPQRFRLQPAVADARLKLSLPNVSGSAVRQSPAAMSREEVSAMSLRRREEIRLEREDAERSTFVLRLVDIKVGCCAGPAVRCPFNGL
jgi:hypothetical protein